MKQRILAGREVSAIGFGGMPISHNADNDVPPRDQAIATIHAGLDAGITFIDTADCYAPAWDQVGHNEELIAEAVRSWGGDSSSIFIATKGGITRSEGDVWGRNGSLDYLRSALDASLTNLGVDVIDLYQYHRPDRWMVYGDVMQNLRTLKDEGLVRAVGISNASVEEIQIAEQVLGEGVLASVQNEFSPRHPGSIDELQYCTQQGIAFLPWSPLGGTGGGARTVGERYSVFAEVGSLHGVSPQQVVLAWELALGDNVIPIPGARRVSSVVDSAAAADLELSEDDVTRLSASVGIFS